MAKLSQPSLFSQFFKLDPKLLDKAGLIDPILNCDTKLFVDPLLLSKSGNKLVHNSAYEMLRVRFSNIIKLVDASKNINDAAWKAAKKLLDLSECKETCLGYGGAGTSGSGRPDDLKLQILETANEIINLGEDNPEIISLMGLFEEGVGPDTISDLCSNIIIDVLAEITENFAKQNGIPAKTFKQLNDRILPENPYEKDQAVILVPKDIVRDLPLATDWSDVSAAIFQVAEIREAFNELVGPMAQATIVEKKKAMKQACLSSLDNFREIFQSISASSNHYDPNIDALNFYNFRSLLAKELDFFKDQKIVNKNSSKEFLHEVVEKVISQFKYMVEKQGLSEMLWHGDVPKRERASQLLFYAIAEGYCQANNIDISPETDMGGGPVDFKFSNGYSGRLLVEIKLSKGTVVHGYTKQLEVYKDAARTKDAAFVIVNVGGMGKKLEIIQKLKEVAMEKNERTSDIYVIDAIKKPSASKRK